MNNAVFQNNNPYVFQIRRSGRGYYEDDYDYQNRDYYDNRDRHYDRGGDYDREPPKKKKSGAAAGVVSFILRMIFLFFIVVVILLPQVHPQAFPQFKPISDAFFEYLEEGLYKYQEVPDKAEFTVERVFTIKSNGPLNYTLYVPIPQDLKIDDQIAQDVVEEDLKFSPQYTKELTGPDKQWVWQNDMGGQGERSITITYHFKTSKIEWDISIDKSGSINDIPRSAITRWGGDQWPVPNYQDQEGVDTDGDGIEDIDDVDDNDDGIIEKYRIEPGNEQIRSTLISILNKDGLYSGSNLNDIGHLNVYRVVKAIYDHIDDTCVYPDPMRDPPKEIEYDRKTYGGYPKWATGTLDPDEGRPRGDCDDQSILFISLCRAAGIPAMLQIGALYDPNRDHWEGHGWANVYMPYTQSYAEQKGIDHVTPMVDIVNDKFKTRDPNRFSEWVDNGKKGYIDTETGEWVYSDLEKRYLAWEYTRGPTTTDIGFNEEYVTIKFKAYPPELKIYI